MLAEDLPPGALLAVTGDHGMVTVDRRHDADTHPDLLLGEPMVGGDPRARLVYTRPGSAPDVLAAWRATLGDDADVRSGEEAVDAGWFGPVDDAVRARVPDVVAATRGTPRSCAPRVSPSSRSSPVSTARSPTPSDSSRSSSTPWAERRIRAVPR